MCRGVRVRLDDGRQCRHRRARGAAGHGRRRPGLSGNHQPARRDRRRSGDGVASRRARERPRVRAVSSDRAARARRAALPGVGSGPRRRRASGQRRRRGVHAAVRPRAAISRRATSSPRAMVREAERTGGPVYLSLAHLDRDWVRAALSRHRRGRARQAGLDFATRSAAGEPCGALPVGGVDTDLDGPHVDRRAVRRRRGRLHAVHGANRLASNSLLEGLVFGARAAAAMATPPDAPADAPRAVAGSLGSVTGVVTGSAAGSTTPRSAR